MPLFDYMKTTQRFINDKSQELVNPADLFDYINRARREIAMASQCIRLVPPVQGAVATITVVAPGSGYTAPTVSISPPDFPGGGPISPLGVQATALASQVGGTINNVDVQVGGSGYFQPTATIVDPTGAGASLSVQVQTANQTQQGQEVYPFANFDVSTFPGVKEIIAVRSVTIIYANYRYSLPIYSFSTYQARIRQFPLEYYYVPTMGTQFGQGSSGSLYLYPIASQPYQLEVDCVGYPLDLLTDQDVEAIPDPWTQAVPYLAAHYCFLQLQNLNAAEYYRKLYAEAMTRYRTAASPSRRINPYGGW